MQSSKGSVSSMFKTKAARVHVNPSLVVKDVVSYGETEGDQIRVSSLAGRPHAATSPGELSMGMMMNPSSNFEDANVKFTSTTISSGFDVETRVSRLSTVETNLFNSLLRNDATGSIGSTGMYTSNTGNATGTNQKSIVVTGTLVNDTTKPTSINPFASNPREPNTQAGNNNYRTLGLLYHVMNRGRLHLWSPNPLLSLHICLILMLLLFLKFCYIGDLDVLIKDIDAGKHEESLFGMTDDKLKVVFKALGAMCDLIKSQNALNLPNNGLIYSIDDVVTLFSVPLNSPDEIDEFSKDPKMEKYALWSKLTKETCSGIIDIICNRWDTLLNMQNITPNC
nr:hypothetical protein [Tanacetum cinerariifolium]